MMSTPVKVVLWIVGVLAVLVLFYVLFEVVGLDILPAENF